MKKYDDLSEKEKKLFKDWMHWEDRYTISLVMLFITALLLGGLGVYFTITKDANNMFATIMLLLIFQVFCLHYTKSIKKKSYMIFGFSNPYKHFLDIDEKDMKLKITEFVERDKY